MFHQRELMGYSWSLRFRNNSALCYMIKLLNLYSPFTIIVCCSHSLLKIYHELRLEPSWVELTENISREVNETRGKKINSFQLKSPTSVSNLPTAC